MPTLEFKFTHDEIVNKIPYALICEAREGARWNTMKRRRLWNQTFTESERHQATRLFRQAHNWALIKGAPESLRMSSQTYTLWQKLGEFCFAI